MSSMNLAGRTALVTGATQGIGEAIARALASEGATVVVHGRDEAKGVRIANEIGGHFVAADLSDRPGVNQLVEATSKVVPKLNILVNNAGVEVGSPISTLKQETLLTTMFVNFHAPVLLLQGLLDSMSESPLGASVINVASIHSEVPVYGNLAYASSKAALHMFTKTAAVELALRGIRVNTLSPGAILTSHNSKLIEEIGEGNFREWIPIGRVGQVEDVVGAALYLAGAASAYVTGIELIVDGGYSQHLVRYRASSHT